jgi:chromosome segregation ATPase
VSDLQELWNSDREQLRQVRELLRKSEARVAELEAERDTATAAVHTSMDRVTTLRTRIAQAVAELDDLRAALGPGEVRDQVDRALEVLR